ncbi:MAG: hypothetical protein J6U10_00805 [Lachnospiraceae bacterium]|nr:hypothetical protein [Lachnospiraceae bacterium]
MNNNTLPQAHTRTKVRLDRPEDAEKFVKLLNSDGSTDKFILENFDGSFKVDARSVLGVIYASVEWAGETYLVNTSRDGVYPSGIREFYI